MTPSPSAPADELIAQQVRAALRSTLADHRRALTAIAPEVAQLADTLEAYLDGGKLLRPRFCYWGGAAVRTPSPEEREALARLGAAIELVQAAALLHDDVIDHSPTRRGRPAVHVAAAAEHRSLELRGDSADHGHGVAIVLGDLALSWASTLAHDVLVGSPAARAEFDLLCSEVMAGQYLDILHQAGGFTSAADDEAAALAVIRWKTVPYTVLRPLRLGAALLGAEPLLLDALSAYAEHAGRGFQLRDDLLGVIGDEDATGKSASSDIAEGKRTLLLALALERATPEDRGVIESVLGREYANAEEISAVRAILRSTGAVATVAQRIAADGSAAAEVIASTDGMTDDARTALTRLAREATSLDGLDLG